MTELEWRKEYWEMLAKMQEASDVFNFDFLFWNKFIFYLFM